MDDDGFLTKLENIWTIDNVTDNDAINWHAIGVTPTAIDQQTWDALQLIEPIGELPWRKKAHPHQLEAANALEPYTLICAGRGSGKTFAASHILLEWILNEPGDYAIVAPTFSDTVKICADGPSGFIKAAGNHVASFNKNNYIIYMANGSRIILASADAPNRVRGLNLTGFWCDELASFKKDEVWTEGLEFATRIGRTRRIITTTPKRGSTILKDLIKRAKDNDPDVRLIRASTRDNAANLSEVFLRTIEQRYAGTSLGRQELDGVLLADVEGALVSSGLIEKTRVRPTEVPELWRIVVGVDPAVTNTKDSDETGIIVAGIGPAPTGWQPPAGHLVLADAPHIYILEDASRRMSVDTWARTALVVSDEWAADAIIAEKNQGHDLVESNIRSVAATSDLPVPNIIPVNASRGKIVRAEPVGALFEQHRMHIVGAMPKLEEQWEEFVPGKEKKSPDRLDACLVGGTLVLTERGEVPIEDVLAGDRVMTRGGWRRVAWSGCTGESELTYRVATVKGSIQATGNHLVWTQRGWVRVDDLLCTDIMFKWNPNESLSSGTRSAGLGILMPLTDLSACITSLLSGENISMSQSGKTIKRLTSLLATIFITETEIHLTIIHRTWMRLRRWTMPKRIEHLEITTDTTRRNGWHIYPIFGPLLLSGIAPRKVRHGTRNMGVIHGLSVNRTHQSLASSVASSFLRWMQRMHLVGAARSVGKNGTTQMENTIKIELVKSAELDSELENLPNFVADPVLSVHAAGLRKVYDLTVEEYHEFVAGGLLVHNCVWSVVGLMPELGIGGGGAVKILFAG
jgi:phage terminase large subunit-like protein